MDKFVIQCYNAKAPYPTYPLPYFFVWEKWIVPCAPQYSDFI